MPAARGRLADRAGACSSAARRSSAWPTADSLTDDLGAAARGQAGLAQPVEQHEVGLDGRVGLAGVGGVLAEVVEADRQALARSARRWCGRRPRRSRRRRSGARRCARPARRRRSARPWRCGRRRGSPTGARACRNGSPSAARRSADGAQSATTRASSGPRSSCRKCPPPAIVVCGWPGRAGQLPQRAGRCRAVIGSRSENAHRNGYVERPQHLPRRAGCRASPGRRRPAG